MSAVLILLVLAVAFANGANDVSRGVGTLVGSGLATYRRGLAWGTFWTVAGALTAIVVSAGLLKTFSTGLLRNAPGDLDRFFLAVAAGVFVWVIFASRTGLPVSTTHAMTGAIVGAAIVMNGVGGLHWSLLGMTVLVPLALSPFIGGLAAYTLHVLGAKRLSKASRYCVCLDKGRIGFVAVNAFSSTMTAELSRSRIVVGDSSECSPSTVDSRLRVTDAFHWASSAGLSFARGMNDNPKIMALGIAAAGTGDLFFAGAAAMAAGSYLYGRRVTNTLAEKVTKIDRLEGLSASVVATTLVLIASVFALPVSTTHVSTGAIVGAGLSDRRDAIHWDTVRKLVLAWIVTLPAAALIAAASWAALEFTAR
jgi:PiT family inorganic phosphate transporter